MNLITEYQKRHIIYSIPLIHDGVCFFNKNRKPELIVTTSSCCRSFITCQDCTRIDKPNIIVELFQPRSESPFSLLGHYHVNPCQDLNAFLESIHYNDCKPFYAESNFDLELWLWKFATRENRVRFLKSQEKDLNLKCVEQMVYAVQRYPKIYNYYYTDYETFLLHRKYILFL